MRGSILGNTTLAVAVAFVCLQLVLVLLYYNRKLDDYARERAEHLTLLSGAVCSMLPERPDAALLGQSLRAAGIESLRLYDRSGGELITFVAGSPPPEVAIRGLARALGGSSASQVVEDVGSEGLLVVHLPVVGALSARSGAAAALGVFDYGVLKDQALSSTASFALPTGGAMLLVAIALAAFLHNLREAQERARIAAQETILIKNRFLSTVSHELRTPLNGILGMLTLLKSTKLSGDQEEYAAMASRCCDSLLALVENILEHVRFEVGRTVVTPARFRLRSEIAEVVAPISQAALVKGIEFAVEIAEGVEEELIGDAPKFRRILENLLDNAVKFTPRGKVTLKISAAEVPGPGRTLLIKVEDTGIGIPPEKLENLFSPLTQGDPSETRAYGGLGIGLALTRELVSAIGGTIVVESREGEGSTVKVRLPFELPPAPPEAKGAVLPLEAALSRSGDLTATLTAYRGAQRSVAAAQAALGSPGEGAALGELARSAAEVGMEEVSDALALYRAASVGGGDAKREAERLAAALGRAGEALKEILEG